MDYKKVLERMGFVDNKDFSVAIDGLSFSMLQQSRMVNQVIHHPEVLEVLDVDGITVLTPYAAAYDEYPQVAELYTLPTPSNGSMTSIWEQIQVEEADIVLLIEEYLKGKENLRDYGNDSLNIVDNQIYSWSFTNVPQPTVDDFLALINPMKARLAKEALVKSLKEAGKKDREMCENVLNLIGGFNRSRVLTNEQITEMQTTFSTIQILLQAARPSSAKSLIQLITPDEVLVTTEMKNLILEELAEA